MIIDRDNKLQRPESRVVMLRHTRPLFDASDEDGFAASLHILKNEPLEPVGKGAARKDTFLQHRPCR